MIARHWRGWTRREHAEGYEVFLKNRVLPGLKGISGYKGGYILRKDGVEETEFVVINFFTSIEAVKEFAGELARMRSLGANARSELRFLFKFRHGAALVHLAMVYDAARDTTVLLVKPLATESDTPGTGGGGHP